MPSPISNSPVSSHFAALHGAPGASKSPDGAAPVPATPSLNTGSDGSTLLQQAQGSTGRDRARFLSIYVEPLAITPGIISDGSQKQDAHGVPYDRLHYRARDGATFSSAAPVLLTGFIKGGKFEVHNHASSGDKPVALLAIEKSTGQMIATDRVILPGGKPKSSKKSSRASVSSSSSSSSSRASNGTSAISENRLRREAKSMADVVNSFNQPDEYEEHLDMLNLMHTAEKEPSLASLSEENIKISVNGTTVGLMTLAVDAKNKDGITADDQQHTVWIDKIVTRPDTNGNGKALLAKAISVSEDNGYGGVVRAFVQSSHDFYAGTGFQEMDGQIQELDPNTSSVWNKHNGQWNYTG